MPLITSRIIQTKEYAEKFVCDHFHISLSVIRSKSRSNESSRARWAVWYVLRFGYCLSFSEIAELYKKDISTVMHGYKAFIVKGYDRDIPIAAGEKFSPNCG